MLAIRMQRTGRKGHAQFRIVVQDSRLAPSSGKFVALLGNYNPHTKQMSLVKEKAEFYVNHGAQPSERVSRLLKKEGVKLPKWVNLQDEKKRNIRNPQKLRKNRSEEEAQPEKVDQPEAEAKENEPEAAVEDQPKADQTEEAKDTGDNEKE